jgi:hypothetical protein
VDGVDGVGSGTLAGSTCIGDGSQITGADAGAEAGAGMGAGAGGTGVGTEGLKVKEKFGGPGL